VVYKTKKSSLNAKFGQDFAVLFLEQGVTLKSFLTGDFKTQIIAKYKATQKCKKRAAENWHDGVCVDLYKSLMVTRNSMRDSFLERRAEIKKMIESPSDDTVSEENKKKLKSDEIR